MTIHSIQPSIPLSSSSLEGSSHEELPLMGFGTFIGLGEEHAESESERQRLTEKTVFAALKAGYRHFDCAAGYSNEQWIGNVFQKAFLPISDGGLGLSRSELFITTKTLIATPNLS